jgi:biopolymer transport protein ExbB
MLDLLEKGGIVMGIIILLSFVATAIIIERFLYFRKIRVDEDKMIERLKAALKKGFYEEAIHICDSNPSPISNLMKVGIEHRQYSSRDIKEAIMSAANLEIPKMERFLTALGTIAHIAPLLGLLGTVTGNIEAFGVLSNFGNVGDPSVLANGISEALLTTAAGIIVSVPAITFYNFLVNKVNHIIIRMENKVNDLVLIIASKARNSRPAQPSQQASVNRTAPQQVNRQARPAAAGNPNMNRQVQQTGNSMQQRPMNPMSSPDGE